MARRPIAVALTIALIATTLAGWKLRVGYLAQQGLYQGEMLWGRVPLDEAAASGKFTEKQLEKLRLVPAIKAFGLKLGLKNTGSYDTINVGWDHTIWNVSAAEPLKFKNRTWWFPIVGTVPYLGFFEEADARAQAAALEAEGLEPYVRTAGAYSTLGWFNDPLLPAMLGWSEFALADTLLHELAHATLWIPGSVQFNESFANFVGEEAAMRYLVEKYGAEGEPVKEALDREVDRVVYRGILQGIYKELDAIYKDPALSRDQKLEKKRYILGSLPFRVEEAPLRRKAGWRRSIRSQVWNNANLLQFKTYNRSGEWFQKLLDQEGGDILKFIARIDEVTRGADDPYAALAQAVGADNKEEEPP